MRLRWQTGVQPCDRSLEPLPENDLVVAFALGVLAVGADGFFPLNVVAQTVQLLQECLFDLRLRKKSHNIPLTISALQTQPDTTQRHRTKDQHRNRTTFRRNLD